MQLNFKTYGQGSALIVLHGLFGSLDNWATHARQWEMRFSVYLVDQRNHGRSPHHPDWSYAVMAEDLHEFMDQQGIFSAHLLGHSMGGKTAMQFACEYPERVEKLIIADMAPRAYPPHHDEILAALDGLDLSALDSRQAADSLLGQRISDPAVRQFLLKSLAREEASDAFRWKFNLPVIAQKYEEILRAIEPEFPFEKPALFISGGRSGYIRPEDHARILEIFPDARFEVIPEAGHWLHAEAPAQFLAIVNDFL